MSRRFPSIVLVVFSSLIGYSGVGELISSPRSAQMLVPLDPTALLSGLLIDKTQSESTPASTMPGMNVETFAELMTP